MSMQLPTWHAGTYHSHTTGDWARFFTPNAELAKEADSQAKVGKRWAEHIFRIHSSQ